MLNDKLIFVKLEHLSGVSAKTNKPYEFANITLSDGLESFKIPLSLNALPQLDKLYRKDYVTVLLDVSKDDEGNLRKDNNGSASFEIVQIKKAS